MKFRLPLALLMLGLHTGVVHATDEPGDEAEALKRPLPTVTAPAAEAPIDDANFDAPALPPPPIDLDYRAPITATPDR